MIKNAHIIPIKAEKGKVLRAQSAEEKAKEAKSKNDRDLAISQSYFDQAPSVQNIIQGIYHWLRGSQYSPFSRNEDVDSYRYSTGTAPVVAAPARAASAVVQSLPRWLTPEAVLGTVAVGTAASQLSRPTVKPISRSVDLAEAQDADSSNQEEKTETQAEQTSDTTPPNENPEDKRGWRDKLADKVANKIRGKKPEKRPNGNDSGTPKDKYKAAKRIWKTYKWSWYIPAGMDAVGNVVGATSNPDTYSPNLKALKTRGKIEGGIYNAIADIYNPQSEKKDSTETITTPPNTPPQIPADTAVVSPITNDREKQKRDSADYAKRLMEAKRKRGLELIRDTL